MDNRETYIKMADNEDIQGLRTLGINYGGVWFDKYDVEGHTVSTSPKDIPSNFQTGDVIALDGKVHVIGTTIYRPRKYVYPNHEHKAELPLVGYDEGDGVTYTSLIWLPRQGQLQKMVDGGVYEILLRFTDWLDLRGDEDTQIIYPRDIHFGIDSMEQLWLAFVMKEKFGKVWVGTDWVKTNRV